MTADTSTIFAVASGAPPAAIAIMRISGPEALAAGSLIAGVLPPARQAGLRSLRHPLSGLLLDRAIVIAFPGPASATGEDMVEFHLHGGRAVIAAVADALQGVEGLRPAVAGEFTRRALIAGRIDLAGAEGLGDLLTAETEGQRRAAMAAVEGVVSRAVTGWSSRLVMISAQVESILDFSDEDDVDETPIDAIRELVSALAGDLASILAVPPVERLRDGVRLVLAGPPNSGKSTLLNVLVGRAAAIVSPIAGTTRDRIEAAIIRDGIAYVLTDTAGLAAATDDPIEAIGIERAREAMASADILVWLGDDSPPVDGVCPTLWLWPRADERPLPPPGRLAISARTGDGLAALWTAIAEAAVTLLPREDQIALNQRQRLLCCDCHEALVQAAGVDDLLIIAEQLRRARLALDQITGATHVEAMLDALFGRFCIGK
ncbi:MAG: tRNA uridine-5-carboxymethylaminomethyl(34) synthesis GTPase MnmE [Sphingomonas sp.]|uniref:tRNA uridine-5-carboxymethylaminomethyl(34) synthesis GTPase MnmE n=1 Tax=Sphingomonas sp. TaxID=28214 RepID=UPI0035A94E42|nr:tRNA uridine-5-carboxymethylaminomethyl(34) synthesis GTPase MnmE [Sphingomonas sp.]